MVPHLSMSAPFRRHFRSRHPQLNKPRIQEAFATNTFFSSIPAHGGFECAQLFVGLESKFIAVYGMHAEGQGSIALEDFIRDYGAPYHLRSDNSKMQTGQIFTSLCRRYNISQSWVKPHHQQQNPAERRIQDMKRQINLILDRTGAPNELWFECAAYVAYLLNRTALPPLNHRTPYEALHGETPDISQLLQFHFFEPVYYYDPTVPFPDSKEELGHFVGIADDDGDTMTFRILTDATKEIISRSTIRSAAKTRTLPNKRLTLHQREGDMDSTKLTDASTTVESLNDTLLQGEAPIINPDTLIGFSFVGKQNGVEMKKTVKSYDKDTNAFELKTPMGGTEWMAYNRLIQEYNEENDAKEHFWAFNKISAHRTKKGKIEVQVKWTTGEITWEPMNIIRMSDPLTLARYAKENTLTLQRGWKWANKIVRAVTATSSIPKEGSAFTSTYKKKPTKTKQRGPKFKFGVEIPIGTKHALSLDKASANHMWEEAMNKEAKGLLDFHTFRIPKENDRPPQGYHFIPLHACYDCKVDGRRKCRIVANGGMAPIYRWIMTYMQAW